jgi:hypothetical protein
MNSEIVSVVLSPEANKLLSENEIDLLGKMKTEGLDVNRTARPSWLPHPEPGSKSVELIILASAAAAPMVATAIARIIDAVARSQRKKSKVTQEKGSNAHLSRGGETRHQTKISFLGLKVDLVDTRRE